MLLSVLERLTMLAVLPKEGNFLTLKRIRELREALTITKKEEDEFGIKIAPAGNSISWDKEKIVDKEIEIDETIALIIAGNLKKLDEAQKLTEAHVSLYEKFVPSGEE